MTFYNDEKEDNNFSRAQNDIFRERLGVMRKTTIRRAESFRRFLNEESSIYLAFIVIENALNKIVPANQAKFSSISLSIKIHYL